MRWIASITATVSSRLSRLASSPVSTRPVTSLGAVDLGRPHRQVDHARGAIELPPESEAREPISVSSEPSAPAAWMPYIGLCGLLPVSFSERAAITAPLMRRGRRRRDPVEDAAQEGAVAVEREAEPRDR